VLEPQERRSAPRISARHLVSYSIRRGDGLYTLLGLGTTSDLSPCGVGLCAPEPLPFGETLDLKLLLGGAVRHARGRIAWARELPTGDYALGVRFVSASLGFVKEILELLPRSDESERLITGDGLLDLIESLGAGSKSGVLVVDSPGSQSALAFHRGKVVAARRACERGLGVLCETLLVREGMARFYEHETGFLSREHDIEVTAAALERCRGQGSSPDEVGALLVA
jgi:hypothetical protein